MNQPTDDLAARGLDTPALRQIYRHMLRSRALDEVGVALQRQGYFAAIAPFIGHEAVQVGSACALDRERDFIFPTYRELAAACAWGVDPVEYLAQARGFSHGGSFDHARARFGPIASVVAGPVLHAVGWALGQQLDDSGGVALVFFGDGASSQGDVHEALNCAGVFGVPVVFLCVNNGWAISVPASEQIAGGSVAARAAGYGMPGVTIDGNDVLAVWTAVHDAATTARGGGGPTLIEARTYRYGPHSTSDDPLRYREPMADPEWADIDPVARFGQWMQQHGLIESDEIAQEAAQARSWASEVGTRVKALTAPDPDEVFRYAYREPPSPVLAQRRRLAEELAE